MPISPTPPYGAAIIVWCHTPAGTRFLLLHRAHLEAPAAREWGWGPPAGARLPDEGIEDCARRELEEETGLSAEILSTPYGATDWPVYGLEVSAPCPIRLSEEHDRLLWASVDEVRELVWPERVQAPLVHLAAAVAATI